MALSHFSMYNMIVTTDETLYISILLLRRNCTSLTLHSYILLNNIFFSFFERIAPCDVESQFKHMQTKNSTRYTANIRWCRQLSHPLPPTPAALSCCTRKMEYYDPDDKLVTSAIRAIEAFCLV